MTYRYYTLARRTLLHIVKKGPLASDKALCGRWPGEEFGFWYPVRRPAGRRVCVGCERAVAQRGIEVEGER